MKAFSQLPALIALLVLGSGPVSAAVQKKPNVLVIWGDDIDQFNDSACSRGT